MRSTPQLGPQCPSNGASVRGYVIQVSFRRRTADAPGWVDVRLVLISHDAGSLVAICVTSFPELSKQELGRRECSVDKHNRSFEKEANRRGFCVSYQV